MPLDPDILKKALRLYRKEADKREENAGYGGASTMRSLASAFEAGRDGMIPSWLVEWYKKADVTEDPDYPKYLELKKKFEDE